MSLKKSLTTLSGRADSFKLRVDESTRIMVDLANDPRTIRRHRAGKGGMKLGCKGPDCGMCKLPHDFPVELQHVVDIHERVGVEWVPRTLWLDGRQIDALKQALPDQDSGICELVALGRPVLGEDGQPRVSKAGNLWCDLSFTIAATSGTTDGVVVDADGVVQDGVH